MAYRNQKRHEDDTDCGYYRPARWRPGLLRDPDDRTRKWQGCKKKGCKNALHNTQSYQRQEQHS